MIKYLIPILLFLTSLAYAGGTEIDNCAFLVTSTTALTTSSNDKCTVPSGSTAWTATSTACASTLNADAGDFAESSADAADCLELYEAPTDPTDGLIYEVKADFIDSGTTGTADVLCIWCGSDSSNYYSICSVDDSGAAYRLYKTVANADTSLDTGGAFSNAETAVMMLRIIPRVGVFGYEGGVEILQSTDTALTSFTKCGIGCGSVQVSTDDCDTTSLRWDNFTVTQYPKQRVN